MGTLIEPAAPPVLDQRRAGILLHITSLPSSRLDDDTGWFMDFMAAAGFSVWQMLPLGPVGPGGSPYSPDSAFAGNPGLIPPGAWREPVDADEFAEFCQRSSGWLDDYALFRAIHAEQGNRPWWQWPSGLRNRQKGALEEFMRAHRPSIERCRQEQFVFERTWDQFRQHARSRGIRLFGDLPMFVVADSADVWANPSLFRLDAHGRPTHVAGVPPDAFSETGQCWDSPVYDWEQMQSQGFRWWRERLVHETRRFDLLRWDHFRGLEATWEIPVPAGGASPEASQGAWRPVPGAQLLQVLRTELGDLPLVAENLGIITAEVEQLRKSFGLPGMHVLQFAFDGSEDNPHLPARHEVQGVVYTGTHDNNTVLGWWSGLSPAEQSRVLGALDRPGLPSMPWALVQAALDSRCRLAVIPLQDLLGLGSGARMNSPGQARGQWAWRCSRDQLTASLQQRWRQAVRLSNRD